MAGQSLANKTTLKSSIKRLISYSNYGNGDVFVTLESNGLICNSGYFINKDSQGFETNYSMLLSAYHAGIEVILTGSDQDTKWQGSKSTVCELYSVELEK